MGRTPLLRWQLFAALLGLSYGLLFIGTGKYIDDILFADRFLPTLSGVHEVFYLPGAFYQWFGRMFRPAGVFSLWLDAQWGGGEVWAYHLHAAFLNGLLLAGIFTLYARLLHRWLPRLESRHLRTVAFLGALFHLLHPLHVEASAWLSCRFDLLMTTTAVWALVLLERLVANRGRPLLNATALVVATLLACGAKEPGFVLLPLLALLAALLKAPRRVWYALGAAALAALALLWFRQDAVVGVGQEFSATGFARSFRSAGFALQMLLWPHPLTPQHASLPHPAWAVALLLLLLALAVRVFRVREQRAPLLFGAALFLLPLIPTWTVAMFELFSTPASERYLFLPLVGAGFLFSYLLARTSTSETARWGLVPLLLLAAVSVPYVAKSRAVDRIALHAAELAPEFFDAQLAASQVLFPRREHERALALLRRVDTTSLRPREEARLSAEVGNHLLGLQRYTEAEFAYRKAISTEPRLSSPRYNLALLLNEKFKADAAQQGGAAPNQPLLRSAQLLHEAIQLDPRYFRAWAELGWVRASLGDFAGAEQAYSNAVRWGGGHMSTQMAARELAYLREREHR